MPAECRPTETKRLLGSEKEAPQQGHRKQLELEKGRTFVILLPFDGVIHKSKEYDRAILHFCFPYAARFSKFSSKSLKQISAANAFHFQANCNSSREEKFWGFLF